MIAPMPAVMPFGSPPRVWGRQHAAMERGRVGRFTPTRVGKTAAPPKAGLLRPVHPHACGEDLEIGAEFPQNPGSPPRVWGRHGADGTQRPGYRFTPTRVGKTLLQTKQAFPPAVHPHACGEDSLSPSSSSSPSGSPPRVWGRPQKAGRTLRKWRFTPTRVGKTGARRK